MHWALFICAAYMFIKGWLMLQGKHVPTVARVSIEDEGDKQAWCRKSAITNFVWGADFAFYGACLFTDFSRVPWLAFLCLGVAIAVALACCVVTYKTNRQFMK